MYAYELSVPIYIYIYTYTHIFTIFTPIHTCIHGYVVVYVVSGLNTLEEIFFLFTLTSFLLLPRCLQTCICSAACTSLCYVNNFSNTCLQECVCVVVYYLRVLCLICITWYIGFYFHDILICSVFFLFFSTSLAPGRIR